MSIFPSLPALGGSRLETINSDVESMASDLESNAGSTFLGQASKEQISSVLHKLQGRAASYKDKYRDLVKNYNEVVRENDKCRVSPFRPSSTLVLNTTSLPDCARGHAG
jgi:hypothetical protein